MSRRRGVEEAVVAAAVVLGGGCSTAPVFGEPAGGGAPAGSTTVASSTGGGPTSSASGLGGEGGFPGTGGAGGVGGGAASSGGGGEGGTCPSGCGERRCGVDACGASCGEALETWSILVPELVSRIVLRPGSSDLLVVGDADRIDRIDTCTGAKLAGRDVGAGRSLRGVGLTDDGLVVGVNEGTTMVSARFLDPLSLDQLDDVSLPASGRAGDRIWGGVAHEGSLWLGLDDDGQGLVQVLPGGTGATRNRSTFDMVPPGGRGLASSPFGLLHQRGDGLLVLLGACSGGICPPIDLAMLPTKGFQVTYADGIAYVPALEGDFARLQRVTVPDLSTSVTVDVDPTPFDDAFTDVAVRDPAAYVSGVTGGLGGSPWVVAFPTDLDADQEAIAEASLAGDGDVAWAIAVDDGGVYVAGARSHGDGFVVKCTHDLQCPSVQVGVLK